MNAQYERKQAKIADYKGPLCRGKLRKVATTNTNWDIYYNAEKGYLESIAKPDSGARDSIFGDVAHVRNLYKKGSLKWKDFTKYGRRLAHV